VLLIVLLGCARSQEGGHAPGGAVSAAFFANLLRPGVAAAATPPPAPGTEPLPSPELSAVPAAATGRLAASAQRVAGRNPDAVQSRTEAAVVLAAPHAPPRILAIALSATTVRGGETVVGQVRTTSNVASVEVRVQGFSTVMTRRSVGDFTLHYPVPMLPPWLHRTYPVVVIARNVDGVSETRTLEVTVE
jgi:hypothetical protein